jgi:hypothetical protein
MAVERILITVKTYPTLSRKYGETVCTAGIREDGSWVRMYPVPFRRLHEAQQFAKYDWIECDLIRNTRDPRPETYRPSNVEQLVPIGHIGTDHQWRERRELLLNTAKVYDRLEDLIAEAKSNITSLAVFKPTKVIKFTWEQEERDWDATKLEQMRRLYSQLHLFEDNDWRTTFRIIPKLPYSFSYKFEDAAGKLSELQVLDWEAGALFWNCHRLTNGDESAALQKVRQKYFEEFLTKDLHFYLGTTQQFHSVAPNPWVIVGVLPIPYELQKNLF